MQVTVTVDVPDRHYTHVRTFRARIRPGAMALSKASMIDALPETQVMPALKDPHDTPDFWQSVCDLLEKGDPDATIPHPAPVTQPAPKPRKATCDLDAILLKQLQDYELHLWSALAGGRQIKRDQERQIAQENAQRARKHQDLIALDPESSDELDGQIAGYEAVHSAVKAIIAALENSYDAYIDARYEQLDALENSLSNKNDTYNAMRDNIIAHEIQEVSRLCLGED